MTIIASPGLRRHELEEPDLRTAVFLRFVSDRFGRVASSGVWPGEIAHEHPIVFDHLAIARPESVGESVG
jgi:hypothetical protein